MKGNGTPYFKEIQVGEILFHLARFIGDIIPLLSSRVYYLVNPFRNQVC